MTIEIISTPIEATVTLTPPAAPVGSVTVTDPSAPAEIIAVTNPAAPSVITIEQAARAAELITVEAPPAAAISIEDRRVNAQITIHADGVGPGVDLDRMIHPAYPVSRRELLQGVWGISGINAYSGLTEGILLFERSLTYDGEGRVTQIQTDDMLSHTRLIKTPVYDVEGEIIGIQREMTAWI